MTAITLRRTECGIEALSLPAETRIAVDLLASDLPGVRYDPEDRIVTLDVIGGPVHYQIVEPVGSQAVRAVRIPNPGPGLRPTSDHTL